MIQISHFQLGHTEYVLRAAGKDNPCVVLHMHKSVLNVCIILHRTVIHRGRPVMDNYARNLTLDRLLQLLRNGPANISILIHASLLLFLISYQDLRSTDEIKVSLESLKMKLGSEGERFFFHFSAITGASL